MLYESQARSIRIHGFVTKIRLENLFWDILAELAGNEEMTTNQLIAKLYDEIEAYRGEVENFASFLRVTCLRYPHPAPPKIESGLVCGCRNIANSFKTRIFNRLMQPKHLVLANQNGHPRGKKIAAQQSLPPAFVTH